MLSRLPGTGFYFTYCGTPTEAILRFKFLEFHQIQPGVLHLWEYNHSFLHHYIFHKQTYQNIPFRSDRIRLFFLPRFLCTSLLHPELPGSHERFQAPEEFLPRGKHLSRLKNRSLFKHHNIFLPISRHLHRQQPLLQPDEAVWS